MNVKKIIYLLLVYALTIKSSYLNYTFDSENTQLIFNENKKNQEEKIEKELESFFTGIAARSDKEEYKNLMQMIELIITSTELKKILKSGVRILNNVESLIELIITSKELKKILKSVVIILNNLESLSESELFENILDSAVKIIDTDDIVNECNVHIKKLEELNANINFYGEDRYENKNLMDYIKLLKKITEHKEPLVELVKSIKKNKNEIPVFIRSVRDFVSEQEVGSREIKQPWYKKIFNSCCPCPWFK